MGNNVRAIVWDFDNTLVDTGARNLSVTRRIVRHVTGRSPEEFAPLRDQGAYDRALHATQDWRQLYAVDFGMRGDQIDEAGRLWTGFQKTDPTPTRWFPGIAETIADLAGLPHGIVSLNTRANIEATLVSDGLRDAFDTVVGCRQVPRDRQKPEPDGLMHCVAAMVEDLEGIVLYVGDHPIDSECAAKANGRFEAARSGMRVVSVAASYGAVVDGTTWPVDPDYRVECPRDIVALVGDLSG